MAHADPVPHQEADPPPGVVAVLVDNHRQFLAFLERRLGDRVLAEDILQEAFVRGVDRLGTLHRGESVVAWFYRLLRNAMTDHYRRNTASKNKLERLAHELDVLGNDDTELSASVCACVSRLAETLKPEYAEALRRVEIDGVSVKSYAEEAGISSSNAGVRVFRAREALRKRVARSCGTCADHGCLDCTCEGSAGHCG